MQDNGKRQTGGWHTVSHTGRSVVEQSYHAAMANVTNRLKEKDISNPTAIQNWISALELQFESHALTEKRHLAGLALNSTEQPLPVKIKAAGKNESWRDIRRYLVEKSADNTTRERKLVKLESWSDNRFSHLGTDEKAKAYLKPFWDVLHSGSDVTVEQVMLYFAMDGIAHTPVYDKVKIAQPKTLQQLSDELRERSWEIGKDVVGYDASDTISEEFFRSEALDARGKGDMECMVMCIVYLEPQKIISDEVRTCTNPDAFSVEDDENSVADLEADGLGDSKHNPDAVGVEDDNGVADLDAEGVGDSEHKNGLDARGVADHDDDMEPQMPTFGDKLVIVLQQKAVKCLLDTGIRCNLFSENWFEKHNLMRHLRKPKDTVYEVAAGNGTYPTDVRGYSRLSLSLGSFSEKVDGFVTYLSKYDCILGKKFIGTYDHLIDFKNNKFNGYYSNAQTIDSNDLSVSVVDTRRSCKNRIVGRLAISTA
ncbi:hypothetical protein TRICI_005035 [Trichomonascus ciferrii]|uniref:Uncharacterized protein n=1 Tax=Trichomonascus ciferrii TaxID=44093 RepID=A0A642UWC1_9ASCO|nr:hypothetical protein TRICI_005035 [Trichomonascus ciferrii]